MSSYMLKRQGNYYFRIWVPQDLQQYFTYPEIKRSLRTKSPQIAKQQVRLWLSKVEQVFVALRSNFVPPELVQEFVGKELPSSWKRTGRVATLIGVEQQTSRKLKNVIDAYIQEHVLLGKWTEKTRLEVESCLNVFAEVAGNRPIGSLNRNVMVDFLEKVSRLPANMNKKPEYRGKTMQQLLDMQDVEPMSTSTVNKYLSRAGALMVYCVRQGYIDRNPAEGLALARTVNQDEERNAYTNDDIKKLVSSLGEVKVEAPERYFVPLIGMYSGARLNEICQLYVEDVKLVEGVWCFDINDERDKRLKTLSSRRLVPMHPRLAELGFLEYVEQLRGHGAVRLWENLPYGRDGYGHLFSKWYQRHNRKHVTADPKKCFHSFRHLVADTLKQQGAESSVVSELLGHSHGKGNITLSRYGKRYRPQVLLETLMKLKY